MIQINVKNIETICDEFVTRMQFKICNSKNPYYLYYKNNIMRIISCSAHNLQNVITEFNDEFPQHILDIEWISFCQYMKKQYDSFIKKNGIWLAKSLNVSVCPYCNRQYTFTIDRVRKIRPQFDHFYPKSKYPYLALSFYNLIPCCSICNQAKGNKEIEKNPYISGFDSDCNFQIDRVDKCLMHNDNWNIRFSNEDRIQTNVDTFSLSDLYNQHKDYVKEIVFRAVAYESSYVERLESEFASFKLSKPEIDRIIWGNYTDPNDFAKRPLSKLTHDIIQQIRE